jgi:hypothetical protein
MKNTIALSLAVAGATLLMFTKPASAGMLNIVTGPTFTPPGAFTDNTIMVDSTVEGGLVHLTGGATIIPDSSNTAEIGMSGTYSSDAGDKLSLAYSFTVDLNIPEPSAYTIEAAINVGGISVPVEASGTLMPGLHKYEGTFASPSLPTPGAGSFTGTLTFTFGTITQSALAAADGALDLEIQQLDFRVAPDVATVEAPSQNQNLSTRGIVEAGDNVLIGGFIITGNDDKQVVLRAIGPSLASHDVTGALADPTLELHDADGAIIATNDNWMDNSEADQTFLTENNLAPDDPAESAIVATLAPGEYTTIVRSTEADKSGVALVEVYDLDMGATDSRLANISTRGNVLTGENVVIGGFIVGGGGGGFASTIIRGLGPSLTTAGISEPLADPMLQIMDANGNVVDSNDNWMDNPNMLTISDDGLAPTDDSEAALFEILPAGEYTAILSGVGETTGVGLVEIYDVDDVGTL